jgi:hypothetical protein
VRARGSRGKDRNSGALTSFDVARMVAAERDPKPDHRARRPHSARPRPRTARTRNTAAKTTTTPSSAAIDIADRDARDARRRVEGDEPAAVQVETRSSRRSPSDQPEHAVDPRGDEILRHVVDDRVEAEVLLGGQLVERAERSDRTAGRPRRARGARPAAQGRGRGAPVLAVSGVGTHREGTPIACRGPPRVASESGPRCQNPRVRGRARSPRRGSAASFRRRGSGVRNQPVRDWSRLSPPVGRTLRRSGFPSSWSSPSSGAGASDADAAAHLDQEPRGVGGRRRRAPLTLDRHRGSSEACSPASMSPSPGT